MDIGMKTSEGDFSLRAAALILSNNQLLAIKHTDYDCFYTIGGGVKVNETSVEAVVREVREETGYQLSVDRLAFIQERFYNADHVHHHEIVFFYLMEATDIHIENGTVTDQRDEKMYWLPIDRLQDTPLVPEFLRTALSSIPEDTVHIIFREPLDPAAIMTHKSKEDQP